MKLRLLHSFRDCIYKAVKDSKLTYIPLNVLYPQRVTICREPSTCTLPLEDILYTEEILSVPYPWRTSIEHSSILSLFWLVFCSETFIGLLYIASFIRGFPHIHYPNRAFQGFPRLSKGHSSIFTEGLQ